MKNCLLIFIAFCPLMIAAQAPNIDWQKVYGGNANERLNKIISTSDGGYLLCGESESGISGDKTITNFGLFDYWIIKTNSTGIIQWQKNFGGSNQDRRPKIIETTDAGFLIAGDSDSNISGNKTENTHGFNDYWIIKLDYNGTIEWQNTIGANYSDIIDSIIQSPDGGYLLAGSSVSDNSGDKSENNVGFPFGLPYYTYFDYWIVKIDALGNIQWDNTIGSKVTDAVTVALNAPDGGYLIGGYTSCDISGDQIGPCYGDTDGWIIKVDDDGNTQWQKKLGGNLYDEIDSAIATSDDGYLIGLVSKSDISGNKSENCRGEQDFWIVKIDALGNVLWDKTIGGAGSEYLKGITEDSHGNFYVTGVSNSNISGEKTQNSRGGYDYWVVKLNQTANVLWDKTLGGNENEINTECCYNPIDDSLTIAGTSLSSNTGDKLELSRGLADYWVVKLESDSLSTTSFIEKTVSVFPNPTSKNLSIDLQEKFQNIEVKLINPLGQLVFKQNYINTSKIDLTVEGSQGFYFLNLSNTRSENVIFKIIKE